MKIIIVKPIKDGKLPSGVATFSASLVVSAFLMILSTLIVRYAFGAVPFGAKYVLLGVAVVLVGVALSIPFIALRSGDDAPKPDPDNS